jgi:hypothetical protein
MSADLPEDDDEPIFFRNFITLPPEYFDQIKQRPRAERRALFEAIARDFRTSLNRHYADPYEAQTVLTTLLIEVLMQMPMPVRRIIFTAVVASIMGQLGFEPARKERP